MSHFCHIFVTILSLHKYLIWYYNSIINSAADFLIFYNWRNLGMIKKFLCIIVTLSLFTGMTAYASDGNDSNHVDAIDSIVPEEKVAQLEQIAAVSNNHQVAVASDDDLDDIYEDNDTRETAYPYAKTKKIEHKDGEFLGHYSCYYAYTALETADDVDWFKVNVRTGYRYVAALKNVLASQVRDIRLYYQTSDGTWRYIQANQKISGQTIFHFMPTVNTYYIEISGEPAPGYKHKSDFNWFAVVPDGTIDERPLPYSNNPSCALQ